MGEIGFGLALLTAETVEWYLIGLAYRDLHITFSWFP